MLSVSARGPLTVSSVNLKVTRVAGGEVIERAVGHVGPMEEHLAAIGRPNEPVRLSTHNPDNDTGHRAALGPLWP
jgi:hypothetical protein